MKAFILGAGMGSRLRPLTNLWPKPLLPIFGKPLITFALDHLRQFGIREFIVNTHHLAGMFTDLFPDGAYRNASVKLVFEPVRLETGGGIKNIEASIGEEVFLVYSGDILTDVPIAALVSDHLTRKNDVTLALRTTGLSSAVSWSQESGKVLDILGQLNSGHPGHYDFAGISVWNPSVFSRLAPNQVASFVPLLVTWIRSGGRIGGTLLEANHWYNIGSRSEYLEVHRTIGLEEWVPDYVDGGRWPVFLDKTSEYGAISQIDRSSYVGKRCRIGEGVVLENSVLLEGVDVEAGTELYACTAGRCSIPRGEHHSKDFV